MAYIDLWTLAAALKLVLKQALLPTGLKQGYPDAAYIEGLDMGGIGQGLLTTWGLKTLLYGE
jgi:hypothetical protein